LRMTGRLTLRSSRPRAVRWPGASAPRASWVHMSVWPAREGTRPAERKNVSRATVCGATPDWTFSAIGIIHRNHDLAWRSNPRAANLLLIGALRSGLLHHSA